MPRKLIGFLKKPILDLIPVFLGVVLALYFENLNENRIEENKIDGLLKKIAQGTEKNIKNLEFQLNQRLVSLRTLLIF